MTYDRTLIEIRERSFLDLLDLALLVVRDRPVTLGLAALAGIAPCACLNLWLMSSVALGPFWPAIFLLEAPWATAPLTVVLGNLMFGMETGPRGVLRALVRSMPALLVAQLAVRGLFLLLVVLYPLMPAQFAFLNEVILLERVSVFQVFRRARSLSSSYEGELFGRWIAQISLGAIFTLCFWMSAETLSGALAGDELTWYRPGLADLGGAFFQTGIWIAIAYFGVVRFLCYIDRRIRLEGWALELRLKAVGRELEEKLVSTKMPAIAVLLGCLLFGRGETTADLAPRRRWQEDMAAAGKLDQAQSADDPVARALRQGKYPWYDPATDRVRPVWPPRRPWIKWLGDRMEKAFKSIDAWVRRFHFRGVKGLGLAGESIGTMLFMAVLVAFLVALLALWARRDRLGAEGTAVQARLGTAAGVAELPGGLRPDGSDLWDLALRRRAAGDYSGAIVYLFAHQLLSLDQLGLIRLGPGRTGRQFVHDLSDQLLLEPVRATLALFEDAYYGGRVPAADAFGAVWRRAEAFEQRRRLLGAPR
jgi:hypothetical protein